MSSELDTLPTPAGQPRAWLLGGLGIVAATLLSAGYAGFVSLRGLTAADRGLIYLCSFGPFLIVLAMLSPRSGRTGELQVNRLGLSLFLLTLWLISLPTGLTTGTGGLRLERPLVLIGTALVCLLVGALLAHIWRAWLRQPWLWALLCGVGLLAGQAAGRWVERSLCGPSCDGGQLLAGALAGAAAGLIWAGLAVPGLAAAVAAPAARAREAEAAHRAQAAARPPAPRWLALLSWAAVAVLVCITVLRQGLQTCGWLDRAIGQSGCALVVPGYGSVYELALAPNGAVLVHDGRASDGTPALHLRRVADGVVLATLAFDDMPLQIRFSPDGRLLAAAGAGGLVRVWGAEDGAERYTLPVASTRVAFSTDGTTLLTSESRWRARDGLLLGPLLPEDAGPDGVAGAGAGSSRAWSPDRSLLAEAASDPAEGDEWIVIRDPVSQLPLRRLEPPGGGSPRDITFSPDGQLLAAASRNWGRGRDVPRVLVWRVSDGALLRSIPLEQNADALAWSADGHLLLVWEGYGRGAMGFRVTPE